MDITETEIPGGGARVAVVTGRLDSATAPAAEARFAALLASPFGRPLVVDLEGVPYASSAGLRALLKAARQAQAAGIAFALAAPQPQVKEVLQVSGFDQIVTIAPTREAAAAKLA
jgi:anti-anti-sigma factor